MRTLLLLTLFAAFAAAQPVTYRIAPAPNAKLQLEVEKTGVLRGKKHLFDFPAFAGTVVYDVKNPQAAKVELVIDTAPIRCLDTWVSESDRAKILIEAREKMLDAARYPQMKFVSTNVVQTNGPWFRVTGNLTIKTLTRSVDVELKLDALDAEGRAVFPMTVFGLKPPSAFLGAVGTKDELTVQFHLRLSELR